MGGEWREVRVGELVTQGVLEISDGYRVRNDELGPQGIPFVRGGDIRDGWINTATEDHIRPEFAERVVSKLSQPRDVAFITKGTVGRAGRLRIGQPQVVFAPQVAYWRVKAPDVIDSEFLFYLIRSSAFQDALYGVMTHGSMVADYVSISQQHDFVFRIPDIVSQRAIARVLGAIDDKIEVNRQVHETLEPALQAFFESWFVNFEPVRGRAEHRGSKLPKAVAELFPARLVDSERGQVPEGWGIVRLGDLIETVKGRSYNSDELVDSETALVTLKSFKRGGGYRSDGLKSFAGTYKENQVVKPGELVIACTDVTQAAEVIGRPAIVRASPSFRTLVASLDTLIVRPKSDGVGHAFLYCLARTEAFIAHTYAQTIGTTVLHLARDAVPSFLFACPPRKVVEVFDLLARSLLARIQASDREGDSLAELRDALLPKLLSGELRVPNAERLLERTL